VKPGKLSLQVFAKTFIRSSYCTNLVRKKLELTLFRFFPDYVAPSLADAGGWFGYFALSERLWRTNQSILR
jgi:hypothetical protein